MLYFSTQISILYSPNKATVTITTIIRICRTIQKTFKPHSKIVYIKST